MNYNQIAILFLQGALVAFIILLSFRLRKKFGIGVLFACLGLFQFMQVFLASTLYVAITNSFLVSPGSSVIFTATLFALLIVYIKEDASETRKIIYALLIVNIVMSVLLVSFGWNFKEASTYNPFNVSTNLFSNNAWSLFIGTLALFLDALLIIIIYEFTSRHIRYIFFRICLTMLFVVSFDTLFFSIVAFWNFENLERIVASGLISKGVFTLFYSLVFYTYLRYFEVGNNVHELIKVKDVFHMLTYKQKFETANIDIKKAAQELEIKNIRYKTLTDISPVGIFQARSDGYTTFVNKRWCEISGVAMDDALGWGWLSAVHPDDKRTTKLEWDLALEQKRISEANYRFILADGSIKWVLGRAVPEYDNKNKLTGFVGTITDITKIKLIQQEQVFLRKKAEESDRLKSAFLENMSHEIRTPMNGILGFSKLLMEPDLSEAEQQQYCEFIEQSGDRLLNIINDIVTISKIESGTVDVNKRAFNINEQQENLYTLFKPEVEAKRIQFTFKSSVPLNLAVVNTDQEKFISIYSYLIKNAIKYTNKGGIEFGCSIKNDLLEFYIKDSGIGVEAERQNAIFERFMQADIEDKMARQGAGLGLAISKAYVEMLGGKIWLDSKIGKGSIFYFTIPYCNKTKHHDEAAVKKTKNENQFENLNILLVEDDEISALLLNIMFAKTGCKILHATNGNEAVELCQKNPNIDVVLMDIRMPGLDGYMATRLIRKFNKKVLIIAQTAHALSGDKEKSLASGFNEHLSKPILKSELFSIIKSHLSEQVEVC